MRATQSGTANRDALDLDRRQVFGSIGLS